METNDVENRSAILESNLKISDQYFNFCGIKELKEEVVIPDEQKRVMLYCLCLSLELKMKAILYVKYGTGIDYRHDLLQLHDDLITVLKRKKEHDELSTQEESLLERESEDKTFFAESNEFYCCSNTSHDHRKSHNYLRYADRNGYSRDEKITETFDKLIYLGDDLSKELLRLS